MLSLIKTVKLRDGAKKDFNINKIINAIWKAMDATGIGTMEDAAQVAYNVLAELNRIAEQHKNFVPTVEGIQNQVEIELMKTESFQEVAKAYILHRDKRARLRKRLQEIPERIKQRTEASKKYFSSPLSYFVYLRSYARWIEEENRRECWIETVDRYVDFMRKNLGTKLTEGEYDEVRKAILHQEVMPSMRLVQFSGNAAARTNVCAYNCSYIAPRNLRDFAEVMYISMCGTGVGFSVESKNIQALPQIKFQTGEKLPVYTIEDSKEGWCDAFYHGLQTWFEGKDVSFDYSLLRPAGARLKTFGGKSSGPEPLRALLDFSREKILRRQGRRLTNIDAHDILCKIGEVVVSGGVRRSAMISLSDLDDVAMRDAKKGQFYLTQPQRSIANNSAVYEEKPSTAEFLQEWVALIESGSGERGIFNRGNLLQNLPERRIAVWKQDGNVVNDKIIGSIGTNPCAEIILQSKQFCNLSEVVARADDDEASLLRKIRIATIIGTYQSTLTNFPYLSEEWKLNCERERLLGVSITGQWDCPAVREATILRKMKEESIRTNAEYANRFGISASTCITCVKPSGTVSQTVDCASGMHPRHAPFYIRRIRISATDSLFKMLRDQGVPYHPEIGQTEDNASTFVLEFPVKAPEGSVYKNDLSAIDQLEHWKTVKQHFTEHNPSVTVSVGDNEWIKVANWVYENWNIVGGLSFLPRSNHVYQLAPYEEIDEQRYNELLAKFDRLDFSQILIYEKADETELKQELACVGGVCEL